MAGRGFLIGGVVAAFLLSPAPAGATFPGANGPLIYSDGEDTYYAQPDGSGHTLVLESSLWAELSADGRQIVFSRVPAGESDSEIYIADFDGSDPVRLTHNDVADIDPTVRPGDDGETIAILFARANTADDVLPEDYDIWSVLPDGSAEGQITDDPGQVQWERLPSVSADGESLAFMVSVAGAADIFRLSLNGGPPLNLTNSAAIDQTPNFSPDSQRIIWHLPAPLPGTTIRTMDADDGANVQTVAQHTDDGAPLYPTYSPDGTKIAYMRSGQIFSANSSDGSGEEQLTSQAPNKLALDWGVRKTNAPDTVLEPPLPAGDTNDNTPTFDFSATEGLVSFECRTYRQTETPGAFASCDAPLTTGPLSDDPWVFQVRALDFNRTPDPSPTTHVFEVDTTPPSFEIEGPAEYTQDTAPTFQLQPNEPNLADQECRVTPSPSFDPCLSVYQAFSLADGPHTFEVRAEDPAGNSGTSSYLFTVDTTPPAITFPVAPAPVTSDPNPRFEVAIDDLSPIELTECHNHPADAEPPAFEPCGETVDLGPLEDGDYAFAYRATDRAGNAGSAQAFYTVDTSVAPCQGKQATLQGSPGEDRLVGTAGPDVIVGFGGRDVIKGKGGNDRICGGDGADRLFGGAGKDRLAGGPGRDKGSGGAGKDRCPGVERKRSC